jgi:predicted metal-dependent peptidase
MSSPKFIDLIESTIYDLRNKQPYIGFILQCLTIKEDNSIPTAGVAYDKKAKKFSLYTNTKFLEKLKPKERLAVFIHETYHITFKHVYLMYKYQPKERQLLNAAMDLVINQLIADLPEFHDPKTGELTGPLTLPFMKQKYDMDLLPNQTTEYYFEQMKKAKDEGKFKNSGGDEGEGDPNSFDGHDWDEASEDDDEAMKALRELFKRARDKMELSYSKDTKVLDDLIQDIETAIKDLNYKKLLDLAYIKSLPNSERKHTWTKPSKRYGSYAPGTKSGDAPKIDTYIDTSGSITPDEYNKFLRHNDKFLKYANKKCDLYYFHTTLYHKEKYKTGVNLDRTKIQSGGTDLQQVIDNIKKTKADLAVIFTDGEYGSVHASGKMPPILFIISDGGREDHPLKHLGHTVKMRK